MSTNRKDRSETNNQLYSKRSEDKKERYRDENKRAKQRAIK